MTWKVHGWQEETQCFYRVAHLIDYKGSCPDKTEIERSDLAGGLGGSWNAWLDKIDDRCNEDHEENRPDAQGGAKAVFVQHPLENDGENNTRQTRSSLFNRSIGGRVV